MGKVGEKMSNEIINESSDNSLQKMKFYVAPEGYDIRNQDTYRVCDIDSDELEKSIANAVRYLSGASVEARIHDNGDCDYVFEASIGTWLEHKKDKIVLYMVKPGDYTFSGKEKASALRKHKESHVYRASSDKLKVFKKMDLEQCLKKYKGFLYCIPHPQNKAQLYPFRTFNELEKIKNMKFSNESAELESNYILESSYKDSLNVYNSLSEQEKKLVSPSGNFDKKENPNTICRLSYKNDNKESVGILEAYKYNGTSSTKAYVVVMVNPKYRGKGISKILLKKCYIKLQKLGYKTMIYRVDNSNTSSIKVGESLKQFGKIDKKEFKNSTEYSLSLESLTALEQAILEEQIAAERRTGVKAVSSRIMQTDIDNDASKEYKRKRREFPNMFDNKSRKDANSETHQRELEKQMKNKDSKKFGADGTIKDHYEAKKALRKDGSLKSKLDFKDFKATKHDKNAAIDYAIDDYNKNTTNQNSYRKMDMTDDQRKKAEERLKHDAENKKQTRKGSGHNIAILSQKYKTSNKIAKGAVNGFTKSAEKAAQAQMGAKSPKEYLTAMAQQYYDQRMPLPDSIRNYVKKKLPSRIHNKAYKKRITTGHETMGLAGIGGPIGTTNAIFVSKLQSPTMLRPQYCVQDDMITDNIITTDNDGVLRKVSSDYLKDKNVRMFKYMGKDPNKRLMTILNSVDTEVPREFIYETISDKYLLDDSQIEFDEDFQEVNFNEMRAMIENDAYTVLNKFIYLANPELANRYTQVSNQESSDLLEGHSSDIVIMEDQSMGYFAMNKKSLRRSRFFENVEDIEIYDDLE